MYTSTSSSPYGLQSNYQPQVSLPLLLSSLLKLSSNSRCHWSNPKYCTEYWRSAVEICQMGAWMRWTQKNNKVQWRGSSGKDVLPCTKHWAPSTTGSNRVSEGCVLALLFSLSLKLKEWKKKSWPRNSRFTCVLWPWAKSINTNQVGWTEWWLRR